MRGLFAAAVLQGCAQDVAERSARVGRTELSNGFLLFRNLQSLDGQHDLAVLLGEVGDAGVDDLADREALRTLLVAVAGEIGATDEGSDVLVVDELHFDAAIIDRDDFAGNDGVLAQIARSSSVADCILAELLDAERDAFLLDIDVENDSLDDVALVELLDDLFARTVPVEVGEVHHAVDIAVEADEQAEFGLVLDFAFDFSAGRMAAGECCPRVFQRLLEAERDTALGRIDFENDDFDFLAGRQDLAGVNVLLGPGHFRDVDQAFDARLQLDECTVVGDIRDGTGNLLAFRILGLDAIPRIGLELLHAERDAVGFLVDADDLNLDLLADVQDFRRMVHAAPCHVGDVQQAVDAAEVDERTVIGDVLDDAVNNLAFFEVLNDFRTLLGTGFFQNRPARYDDVAAALVHLEDFEGLRVVHQWGNVADRADIDLRTRQEGDRAVEVDREAALDLVEDHAFDALAGFELGFELDPAFFAASLLARQNGFAKRVFDALDIDFDFVADLQRTVLGACAEFLERDAAFNFEADVDNGHVLLDTRDDALGDIAFCEVVLCERLFEKSCEILAGGSCY
ncbi:hypothetical protein RHECNPAF_470013 [Rhizobium etli CNPAF512]|nr:hypothetical protein RHECNPAF_470013 [Rhizobium etli CNPAF512]